MEFLWQQKPQAGKTTRPAHTHTHTHTERGVCRTLQDHRNVTTKQKTLT